MANLGDQPLNAPISKAALAQVVQDALWSPGDLKTTGVAIFAGINEPSGWLLCDGRQVSRSTYSDLFTALTTVGFGNRLWGEGNGTTTFSLPDFRGRAPVGAGDGLGLSSRVVGDYVGAETHTLNAFEVPAHSHSLTLAGSHNHTGITGGMSANNPHQHIYNAPNSKGVQAPLGGTAIFWGGSPDLQIGTTMVSIEHGHSISTDGSHGHTVSSFGGGLSHNNMQPSACVAVLIKT